MTTPIHLLLAWCHLWMPPHQITSHKTQICHKYLKIFPQYGQGSELSLMPMWMVLVCLSRCPFFENILPQSVHLAGLWIWRFRWTCWKKKKSWVLGPMLPIQFWPFYLFSSWFFLSSLCSPSYLELCMSQCCRPFYGGFLLTWHHSLPGQFLQVVVVN